MSVAALDQLSLQRIEPLGWYRHELMRQAHGITGRSNTKCKRI